MSNSVQNLKIYDIIEQFEDLMENSPKPKLGGSATKRIVDVEEVFDLMGDLKTTIPEDIRRANSIMTESQSMVVNAEEHARDIVQCAEVQAARIEQEAKEKADQTIRQAREEYERLVVEDEIYQEAQRRAKLLAAKAEYNATEVYENAKVYADNILADLERFIGEYRRLVEVNRKDLGARARVSHAVIQQPSPQPVQPISQPVQPISQPVQPISQPVQPIQQPAQPLQQPAVSRVMEQQAAPTAAMPVKKNAVQTVRQAPIIDDDDDDFDEEEEHSGFLFGLFKKKKKIFDEEDFEDEDI